MKKKHLEKIDWKSVDWTLPDWRLSFRYDCSTPHVSHMRREHGKPLGKRNREWRTTPGVISTEALQKV